jgi:SAM-dependent methyltransferase
MCSVDEVVMNTDMEFSTQEDETENKDLANIYYTDARILHWNKVAQESDKGHNWGQYYHKRIEEIFQFLVPPGQKVLEVGCGRGDLLAALEPRVGVGIDFSCEMITRARARHPEFIFREADAHFFLINDTFDFIILSDLVNDLWDIQVVFDRLQFHVHNRTRIIINLYSRLWELPLSIVKRAGLAKPTLYQNWLTIDDLKGLLELSDFEVIKHWEEILWPIKTPFIAPILNRFFAKVWPFSYGALTNFMISRPIPKTETSQEQPLVSVIIPARNEAGNIPEILERVPQMGRGTELIFVEGGSTDGTYEVIHYEIDRHPGMNCQVFQQTGTGKGDAVRLGMEKANGEIVMVLDADMTVAPEDLLRFYRVLVSGKGEFINGVRLVYPMENQAMRFFNLVGNKFFSVAFSWLLGIPVKDTLCGTKALWRSDYERITSNRWYFGDFDPFGDFDLLFGAARLGLKIVDLPIRYRDRIYGTTNIQRWKHGMLLLKMVNFAARRVKFI